MGRARRSVQVGHDGCFVQVCKGESKGVRTRRTDQSRGLVRRSACGLVARVCRPGGRCQICAGRGPSMKTGLPKRGTNGRLGRRSCGARVRRLGRGALTEGTTVLDGG